MAKVEDRGSLDAVFETVKKTKDFLSVRFIAYQYSFRLPRRSFNNMYLSE